jgi:folate-binding protein YgfZ
VDEPTTSSRATLLVPLAADALLVTGKDRVRWLNGMVTCDVAKIPAGGASYGLHVGKQGKIAAELWIHVGDTDVLVAAPAGRGAELVEALDRYLIMEDCVIAPAPGAWSFALALGPEAAALATLARERGLRAGVGRRAGQAALVAGDPGAAQAWQDEAAAREGVLRADEATWERARVALGIGAYGVDFDGSAYPQEAAVEADAVSFSKGCYLGQEAVFMMQERGHPPRRLVQLAVDGDALPEAGAAVATADGAPVGAITSRVTDAGRVLALGTVKWKHAREGTELVVGGRRAVVTPLLAIRR